MSKTIYKHIGYINDFESIQSVMTIVEPSAPCGDEYKKAHTTAYIRTWDMDELVKDGDFIPTKAERPDSDLVLEEESNKVYFSKDKKYAYIESVCIDDLKVDTEAEGFDPNKVSCDSYIDIFEFDNVENDFSYKQMLADVRAEGYDNFIVKCDTSAIRFDNPRLPMMEKFDCAFREFAYQYNRKDYKKVEFIGYKQSTIASRNWN